MNYNALLYYKNIEDLCSAYDRKINQLNYAAVGVEKLEVADKTLYLFCQLTATYCALEKSFVESQLSDDLKNELRDCLDDLKSRGSQLLARMEYLHASLPGKFDPTKEFIEFGKFLYKGEQNYSLRESLEKAEANHQKNMSKVREYKNAVVHGFIMSQYSMVDASEATHKLSRSKVLIDHCLTPAASISESGDIQAVGDAVKRKTDERESRRQISSILTPNGMMCSFYSHTLTLEDQKQVMSGRSVESVMSQKGEISDPKKCNHIFSLLTTDHTGLIYTQASNKFGEFQIGKWFKKDDDEIAHLLTFKSQNKWDGQEQVENNDYINSVKSTINMWKSIKGVFSDLKDKLTENPLKRGVEDVLEKILSQETAIKIADFVSDPSAVTFTLRSENPSAIIQSSTQLDSIAEVDRDSYLKMLKNKLKQNATVHTASRGVDSSQWEANKKWIAKKIDVATKTLDFLGDSIKNRSFGLDSTLSVASMLLDEIVPFDDFASTAIDDKIKGSVEYADKLLEMAVANEKYVETLDDKYQDKIKEIGESFTQSEAKLFVKSIKEISAMEEDIEISHNSEMTHDR